MGLEEVGYGPIMSLDDFTFLVKNMFKIALDLEENIFNWNLIFKYNFL